MGWTSSNKAIGTHKSVKDRSTKIEGTVLYPGNTRGSSFHFFKRYFTTFNFILLPYSVSYREYERLVVEREAQLKQGETAFCITDLFLEEAARLVFH